MQSAQKKEANRSKLDESALVVDDVYIDDNSKLESFPGDATLPGPSNVQADFDTSYQAKTDGKGANSTTAKASTFQKGAATKKKFGTKVKKGAGKGVKRNQSELNKTKTDSELEPIGEDHLSNQENDEDQEPEEPAEPLDAKQMFEKMKQRFFETETNLNTDEQLQELKEIELEKMRRQTEMAKLEEERKRQEEEELAKARTYGPGGRFGKTPSVEAITAQLEEQARVRRLKR